MTARELHKQLPIWPYKQRIIDTVTGNRITVIIGETGSGKTTQIAQVLQQDPEFDEATKLVMKLL